MISSLRDIPSLSKALTTSKLLGIYFASSWCPDCTPTTPMIQSFLQNIDPSQQKIQIAYVSSDNTKSELESMVSSMKPINSESSFTYIPFKNEDERSNVKKLLGVCAGKESVALGLIGGKRKYGIPTLAVIHCETLKVVTMDGIGDMGNGDASAVLEQWLNSV